MKENRWLKNTVTLEKMILLPDEPCWKLVEMNLPPPDFHEHHRYQLVRVCRNDALVWVRMDLGLVSDWGDTETFSILGHPGFTTVAKMQEIADEKRADLYWQRFLAEQLAEEQETFIPRWIDEEEELQRIRRNQSQFGPGWAKQRNGLDTRLVHRSLR